MEKRALSLQFIFDLSNSFAEYGLHPFFEKFSELSARTHRKHFWVLVDCTLHKHPYLQYSHV